VSKAGDIYDIEEQAKRLEGSYQLEGYVNRTLDKSIEADSSRRKSLNSSLRKKREEERQQIQKKRELRKEEILSDLNR